MSKSSLSLRQMPMRQPCVLFIPKNAKYPPEQRGGCSGTHSSLQKQDEMLLLRPPLLCG